MNNKKFYKIRHDGIYADGEQVKQINVNFNTYAEAIKSICHALNASVKIDKVLPFNHNGKTYYTDNYDQYDIKNVVNGITIYPNGKIKRSYVMPNDVDGFRKTINNICHLLLDKQ